MATVDSIALPVAGLNQLGDLIHDALQLSEAVQGLLRHSTDDSALADVFNRRIVAIWGAYDALAGELPGVPLQVAEGELS